MKPIIFIPTEKEKGMIDYYIRIKNQLDTVPKPDYRAALEFLPLNDPIPTAIVICEKEAGDEDHGEIKNKTPYNDQGGNI